MDNPVGAQVGMSSCREKDAKERGRSGWRHDLPPLPGETTMSIRDREDRPSEPTGDILTFQHEDDPEVGPSPEPEPLGKPLVAFEALPVKTVPSSW